MKIVHVEDFVHPDAGYQINMLGRLQVAQGHEVDIVCGELDKIPRSLTDFFGRDDISERDSRFARECGANIHRIGLHGYFSGRAIFHLRRLFSKVDSLEPDVVFVHGEDTLTGIIYIILSRFLSYPIALDCHMVEMASKNRFRNIFRFFYRNFISPIILRRKIPLIRVVDSDFVEKCLGIPLKHTHYLSLGTDTSFFKPDSVIKWQVREELGLNSSGFLVIYAGKLDEDKGGLFFSKAIQKKIVNSLSKDVQFLIIGNAVGEYGRNVEVNFSMSENHIVRLPTQRYLDLARLYQAADIAVFPRQCSMSFFEAQSCGLPVLFESNEINSLRSAGHNAFEFEPMSIDDFRKSLSMLASMSDAEYIVCSKAARDFVMHNYNFVPIAQQYTDVLENVVRSFNSSKS